MNTEDQRPKTFKGLDRDGETPNPDDPERNLDKITVRLDEGEAQHLAAEGEHIQGPLRFPGYELIDRLGRGGMGEVWQARQISTQREVALKILPEDKLSALSRRRFELEVELTAQLEHPNIARLYEARRYKGQYCYAMELVPGKDLYEHTRSLDEAQKITLMVKVCRAVQSAHARGIIHRDLKPANIIVTPEGEPKVLDFGLAKHIESSPLLTGHATVGTPAYMSPEQVISSATVDFRSDVYTLGVILYEILLRRLPYSLEGGAQKVMSRITQEGPTPPRKHLPEISRDLDAILMRCLQLEPADRYRSAGGLADDLSRYLDGEPVQAQRQTAWYVLRTKLRKHRLKALLALLAFLSIIAVIVWSHAIIMAERDDAERARRAAIKARDVALQERDKTLAAMREADKQRSLADEQRALAGDRFDETRDLALALIEDIDAALPEGPTRTRERLARTSRAYLERLRATSPSEDAVLEELARASMKLGEVLRTQGEKDGSDTLSEALASFEQARGYFGALAEAEPERFAWRWGETQAAFGIALCLNDSGLKPRARSAFLETLELVEARRQEAPERTDVMLLEARVLLHLPLRRDEARSLATRVLEHEPSNTEAFVVLATLDVAEARREASVSRLEDAVARLERLREELDQLDLGGLQLLRASALLDDALAAVYLRAGRSHDALVRAQRAEAALAMLTRVDPYHGTLQTELAQSRLRLAESLRRQGQPELASATLAFVIGYCEQQRVHHPLRHTRLLSAAWMVRSRIHRDLGQLDEAARAIEIALDMVSQGRIRIRAHIIRMSLQLNQALLSLYPTIPAWLRRHVVYFW